MASDSWVVIDETQTMVLALKVAFLLFNVFPSVPANRQAQGVCAFMGEWAKDDTTGLRKSRRGWSGV
jgi:hypothetical protein